MTKFLRIGAIKRVFGVCNATVYNYIQKGLLPPSVSLGIRCSGWPAHEIEAIAAARIAGRSNDEIRLLVNQILKARKTGEVIEAAKNQITMAETSQPSVIPARPVRAER